MTRVSRSERRFLPRRGGCRSFDRAPRALRRRAGEPGCPGERRASATTPSSTCCSRGSPERSTSPGSQTQIDVNASDVLGNLKFAALANYRGEARKWAVLADIIYMNVGGDGTGTQELSTAEVDVKEFIAEIDGAWRISKSFELLAGGRYTHLRTTVTLTTPGSTSEAKIEEDWFDPIVGAQAFLPLSKAFQLQLRGDVGGFHVGSNFTWQAIARVNWQVSRVVTLGIGYRWLDQDFETGSGVDYFRWDILTQGPLLAGGIKF